MSIHPAVLDRTNEIMADIRGRPRPVRGTTPVAKLDTTDAEYIHSWQSFDRWVRDAEPGAIAIYHEGVSAAGAGLTAAAAWEAYQLGNVLLVQERLGFLTDLRYLAIRATASFAEPVRRKSAPSRREEG